ncbi:hypothetical protein KM043_012523 [Ampulex compressa]|nr:hypothetical protein KM043_012523 [Ampulex compressa]
MLNTDALDTAVGMASFALFGKVRAIVPRNCMRAFYPHSTSGREEFEPPKITDVEQIRGWQNVEADLSRAHRRMDDGRKVNENRGSVLEARGKAAEVLTRVPAVDRRELSIGSDTAAREETNHYHNGSVTGSEKGDEKERQRNRGTANDARMWQFPADSQFSRLFKSGQASR